MIAVLVRVATLTGIYLLILTSVAPGDILVGLALSALIVAVGWRVDLPERQVRPPGTSPGRRLAGVPGLIGGTLLDMGRGAWTVAGYCLGRSPAPGLVTIPIRPDIPSSATAWAVRVGLAPDSVVVAVDDERGELLLHVMDASDPDAVRRVQQRSYQRYQRRVFP